jgi:large subunit ribosomal protein L25
VTIPIMARGEARGVKVDGGILEIIMRTVQVECLPGDIPERIEVDVTDLGINDAIRVSNLPVNEKVKVIDDADQVIVHVISVKEEAAPAAAAPAEGEAAAAATPAEPEVAKKGKKDEEAGDKKPTDKK